MSRQSTLGLDQLQQQTHVAQQSRQQKLRVSGSEHSSSPQSHSNSEHLQEATSSYPEGSARYSKGYPEHTAQNNTENVFPGYNIYMVGSDPYNFLGALDSQPLPAKNTSKFHAESAQETPPLVGNIKSGDSSIPVSFNSLVNPARIGSWGSEAPQIGMMNNHTLLNMPLSVNNTSSVVASEMLAAPSRQSSTFGSNVREESMATFFPGSSIETDTMQTLYLMNPGVGGYTHSVASGNMVLINNTPGNVLATHNFVGNDQRHFIEISVPTASPSPHSSLGAVENSAAEQHGVTSSILTSVLGANAYNSWQGGGNEMTFIQTTDAASSNQPLRGQLNHSAKLDNQSVAKISRLGMRHPPMLSIEEQQPEILTRGLGLQLDQSPTATGQRQELSLRLSPQLPSTVQAPPFQNHHAELDINCPGIAQATSEENAYGVDVANQDGMMGAGFSNSVHSPAASKGMQSSLNVVAEFPNILRGSRYLKAAQELLDEVVSLVKLGKHDFGKHHKSQSLFVTRTDIENTATKEVGKDGIADDKTLHTSAEEANNPHNTELTPAERQELQIKKAKLVAMLDEVDRKYRQYYHQMQIVVSSFEAVTEVGAAKTYTSLALQTISRQFRCLRDAITGQIRVASKSLGEEEITESYKGESSHLRFMDQQLRQQRTLQQLGMIQQHAWRPQRGLPERSVSVLRAWLFEHFLHPYPKDADKLMLARQAGLTRSQVSNWFINARVRLWKPMVEEMYMEETKEAELGHASTEKYSKTNAENKEEIKSDGGPGNSQYCQEQKHKKTTHLDSNIQDAIREEKNITASGSLKSEHSSDSKYDKNRTFSMEEASDEDVFHEVQDEGATQGQLKKARNGIEDHTYHFASNCPADTCDNKFIDGRHNNEDYSLVQNCLVLADVNGCPGSYQLGCLNRYEQDSFISRFSGSGGVSLTLGLQQSNGISFSRIQQSCIASQEMSNELGRASDDNCNIREAAVAHAYDSIGLQNRKRYDTHPMQTL